MKFILNTALDPHFCALFDEQGQKIAEKIWDQRNQDGAEIHRFLEEQKIAEKPLTFLGGVTGPGGFSSLRVGSGILNTLSFAKKIPVHAVRADHWARDWLGHKDFVLNSFSDSVWILSSGELERMDVTEAAQKFSAQKMYVGFLPEEKQKKFANFLPAPEQDLATSLLTVLQKQSPQEQFFPDYEVPPV